MANAEKQRIEGYKEELNRAREKHQGEITALRDLERRRDWLEGERASISEKLRSIIFMDPSEVAAQISHRNALMEMLNCVPGEHQSIQYRINATAGDVSNAEKRLKEEEVPAAELQQWEFLRM